MPPGFVVAESPIKRLPAFFHLLENVTRTADRACAARHDQLSRSDVFDMAVFVRAINLLKASRTLLADGHWEVAASAARQLFELLVNMEYLTITPDPDDERLRYAKYGLLQYSRSQLRTMDYNRSTGRPVNDEHALFVHDLLEGTAFEEFRTKDGRWRSSWSGKSTKALAEVSPSPLRINQYEQLFVTWSEETHGAPIALLEHILPKSADGWVERQIAKDDLEIGQMTAMLVTLFLELWNVLPGAPDLDPEIPLDWMNTLLHESEPWRPSATAEEQ